MDDPKHIFMINAESGRVGVARLVKHEVERSTPERHYLKPLPNLGHITGTCGSSAKPFVQKITNGTTTAASWGVIYGYDAREVVDAVEHRCRAAKETALRAVERADADIEALQALRAML